MFCTNCGATIPENSAFCTNCGAKAGGAAQAPVEQPMQPQAPVYEQPVQPQTPVYEQPVQPQAPVYEQPVQPQAPVYEQPVQPQAPVYQQAPYGQPMYQQPPYGQAVQLKKKKGPIALIIGIIVAIIVVVILLVVFVFGGSDKNKKYSDPISKMIKGINERDLKYIYDAMPAFATEDIKEDIEDYYDDEEEFWDDEFYVPDYVSSYSISWEEDEKEKLDKDYIDELEEEIEDYYDKKVTISEGYEVEIELTTTTKYNTKGLKEVWGDDYAYYAELNFGEDWKKGVETSEFMTVEVLKISGEWYIIDMDSFF